MFLKNLLEYTTEGQEEEEHSLGAGDLEIANKATEDSITGKCSKY